MEPASSEPLLRHDFSNDDMPPGRGRQRTSLYRRNLENIGMNA
jgi:hypothetical protein